jgi:phospholipid/cholesterol/gamma-HCH transport system permease protein
MSTDNTTSSTPADSGRTSVIGDALADWGGVVVDGVSNIGDITLFTMRMLAWLFFRAPKWETLLPNFYQVGVLSLPVIALTGTFIGMVLSMQSYFLFKDLNLESYLGAVINKTLLRELGPVLAATMLAGRVGCAMSAELGTMRVTEQIDALESMGSDPVHYLVVPRFLACIFLIPTLTIMADYMGVVGGYFHAVVVLDVDKHYFWYHSERFVNIFDLFSGVLKSVFFGAAIAIVSCHRGFNCQPGAEGVGRAATASFVYSFVLILVIDLVLGQALYTIYYRMYPDSESLF